MDEFYLYNQLRVLEDIVSQYEEGDKLIPDIRANAELIASHMYRVAVIGEFKRGKSSLINALIGSSILPTDIIPLTAAVTRLTYGIERRITVCYRDGTTAEKGLEELMEYATKYDRQHEIAAEAVREIVVNYPSVLCKNHIEILDTPGLNDNESMSEKTLSVLGEIDAAIVVIAVNEPLSLTEQKLILTLICQEGIRHLIFAVTFLDSLFDEEEKDKMLSFIRKRISNEVLNRAREMFVADEALLRKSEQILTSPDVYGVSSRQAMQGFTNDDRKLLEESRLPAFKEELLATLTAAQSEDLPKRVESIAIKIRDKLPDLLRSELEILERKKESVDGQIASAEAYIQKSNAVLIEEMLRFDSKLEEIGFSQQANLGESACAKPLLKCFIARISALTADGISNEAILNALEAAQHDAEAAWKELHETLEREINLQMAKISGQFQELRCGVGISNEALGQALENQFALPFPLPHWEESCIPDTDDLMGIELMPTIRSAVCTSLTAYGKAIARQIADWRVLVLRQNIQDCEALKTRLGKYEQELTIIKVRSSALTYNYQQHQIRVGEICKTLNQEI